MAVEARVLLARGVVLALTLAGLTAAAAAPQPGPVPPDDLREAASGAAPVRCLVLLEQGDGPDGSGAGAAGSLPEADVLERSWAPQGVTVTRRYPSVPALALEVPAGWLLPLAADPLVAAISRVRAVHAMRSEGKRLMKVGDVRNLGFDGQGVGIAVLDTGVDYGHDELEPGGTTAYAKTVKLYDAIDRDEDPDDEQGHGTAVAGIAAGHDGGVAPAARVVAVRVLDAEGKGDTEQILAGLDAVLDSVRAGNPFNIRVLNMSLGGYDGWPPNPGTCDGTDAVFAAALDALREAGVLVVVAAGNGGCSKGVAWPACFSAALAVGAVYDDEICATPAPPPFDCLSYEMSFSELECRDTCTQETKKDRITCYSDSSDKTGVWAPSHCARTPRMGGGEETCFGGTSAAAPYVAGVAALLFQAYPGMTPATIQAALERTGVPHTDARNNITRNRVDALAAYQLVPSVCPTPARPAAPAASAPYCCAAGSYALSWPAASGADSYRVQRATSADFAGAEEATVATPGLRQVFQAASAATLYHRVRAETACGAASAWSPTLAVAYGPTCPRLPRRRLPRAG